MKNISKTLFLSFISACTFWACTKDEVKDYYTGGTNPVLAASATALNLSYANAAQTAVTFSWTNPNYQFTTGVSSQNVIYLVEIDTTGANFTNPGRQTISVSKDLSLSISTGTFNDYLLNQLQLKVGMVHNLDVRVTATLLNSSVPLFSNVLKLTATPYAIPPKVTPPASGKLYLVGSATAGGWNNPVPVPTQQFTQVSSTVYQITVALTGGQEYLFLPVNGDWSHKYACKNTPAGTTANTGGDFGYDFNDNFPGPTASGNYLIIVDFQRGKFTVTKQ